MHLNSFILILICLFMAGCASSPPAPVIDRTPAARKPAQAKPAEKPSVPPEKTVAGEKDWRPDVYTVKKGDTLYSIGLQYGFDYREIAQANNIAPPYPIHVGQQLQFQQLKASSKPAAAPATVENDGVIVTPLKTESAVVVQPGTEAHGPTDEPRIAAGGPPVLKEPRALREPYSELALATPPARPKPEKPADQARPEESTKPADPATRGDTAKTGTAASADDEAIDWAWPASGKIIAGFNEGTNTKGVDIGGSQGQPVNAAASGKVIYSGSDLRGYGKLVIIKHNKTYLSVYAHNNQLLVKEGQQVNKGQKIAEMGSTDSDRVKLHFEIRKHGKSVDPANYLAGNP